MNLIFSTQINPQLDQAPILFGVFLKGNDKPRRNILYR